MSAITQKEERAQGSIQGQRRFRGECFVSRKKEKGGDFRKKSWFTGVFRPDRFKKRKLNPEKRKGISP